MGGRGSGGRRVGSGQKPRRQRRPTLAVVVSHPSARASTKTPKTPKTPPIGTFDPPAELQDHAAERAKLTTDLVFLRGAERPDAPNPQIADLQARLDELTLRAAALAIWHELAPSAFAARTLTPATSAAFVMLCRAVVQERELSASPSKVNGPDHRGVMHRVATWMKDFCLSPFGKPLYEAATPAAAPVSKWPGLL